MNFNKVDVINFIGNGNGMIALFIAFFFPFYFGFKLLNVVLLAIIATISCAALKVKIGWKENFIISGYALTPPIITSAVNGMKYIPKSIYS